jgi:hypothetical protein
MCDWLLEKYLTFRGAALVLEAVEGVKKGDTSR